MKRSDEINRLGQAMLDVLVIGGGIVGSGVARDAAMRGLRTGLVERHDFAFGTSGRSSRLLHGGLRYLEQGRVKLVREASVEKMRLHKIAPHLAEPLGFIFPSYRHSGRPLWQLTIGVKLYDLLCGGRNLHPSHRLSRTITQQLLPQLKSHDLQGAVCYYDGLTNDARLVMDTLSSASRHGASISNYLQFKTADWTGAHWNCAVHDLLTKQTSEITARTIVNATGPWAEQIPHSQVKLRLSKGIHIVIDRRRLAVPRAVVITEGKRILFILPWGERVIVGTTDTDYRGAPEDVAVNSEDMGYILGVLANFFPAAAITETDVISSWAGVRPLVANPDGTPSDISRAHQIISPQTGWWDITGGKLTTYRLMAEQAVDKIMHHLGRTKVSCRTAREALLPTEDTVFSGIRPAPFTREAVVHFVEREWAVSLADVMVRRSGWHYYYEDAGARAETVASWMADCTGWTSERQSSEIRNYLHHVAGRTPVNSVR